MTATTTGGGNGIHVEYHEKPYRHYQVNPDATGIAHVWTPEEPYGRVPSVTQAIGVIDKSGPLQHYAATKTLEGVVELGRRRRKQDLKPFIPWNPTKLLGLMRAGKLMYYDRTTDAADRGIDLHQIWEDWSNGIVPVAKDWPEDRRGAIQSMARFIVAKRPRFIASERVVGSATHGYGGRMDSIATLEIDGRTGLIDVKNSKAVYPRQHWPQLKAYEGGNVECGGEPTDFQAILRLDPEGGEAQLVEVPPEITLDHFLAPLALWRSQQTMPERICTRCSLPATTRRPHPELCKAHTEEAKG